jgi:predicted nucleic acid-binding protein
MKERLVVADSSPLVALSRIGYLHLLPALLGKLHLPPAVRQEVFGSHPLPGWVAEVALQQPVASRITSAHLGPGEREAIALALELSADEVILDDLAARRLAYALRMSVIGTFGLLLRAKKRGLVPLVRPLIEALQSHEFHASARLVEGILVAAGEGDPLYPNTP